ncbi:MAG: ABC transporter ATP-binding protein [Bacilli bacterium]
MSKLSILKKYILKGQTFVIIVSFITAMIFVGSSLYITLLIGKSIDFMLGVNTVDFAGLSYVTNIIISLLIIAFITKYIFEDALTIFSARIIKNIRHETFSKINRIPISYIDSHMHGDLVTRNITDIENIGVAAIAGFKQLYIGVITIFFTIIFMLTTNYILGLIVIALTPITLFVSSLISRKCSKYYIEKAKNTGNSLASAYEIIANHETIKLLDLETNKNNEFLSQNSIAATSNFKATFVSSRINPSTRLINNIIYVIVLLSGVFILLYQESIPGSYLTIGSISAFLAYSSTFMRPFNDITSVIPELKNGFASLNREVELYEVKDEENSGGLTLEHVTSLKFDDVSFSYVKNKNIISNFNFEVDKEIHVALVGPTGCGKTTLINLLMRFYEINKGKILINNVPIDEYELSSYRSKFAMVLQDSWIFAGSILENIRYGNSSATIEEVKNAARSANAEDFILQHKDGYDTYITSESLSKGEAQLISIARLFLINPQFIILDEATSNIDALTELKINDAFKKLMKGKISIVIAHRLGTIKNSDVIIALKNGEIQEIGDHQSLLDKKGFYYELYKAQFM